MKKLLALSAAFVLVFGMAACSKDEFRIAMITDSGSIDDQSFNQGTWEGIVEFAEANDITHKYYKPLEVSDTSYLETIELAIDGGAEVVVTPGYLFETSVYAAQESNPDVKFILIDGVPHSGGDDDVFLTKANTLSILFAEEESGFLAGYAAVKEGYTNLGYIGGQAVPAVVKFGIGYVAGAFYAAEEMDVTIDLKDDNYVYLGSFAPSDVNKNLAASWYAGTDGVELIFAAAGGAGSSVMAAASDASKVMIGVDVDQSGSSPTVLTSAMKELGNAVKQGLQTWLDDAWVGGVTVQKNAVNDGVGLPMDTSRFTTFTQAQYDAIFALIKTTVDVPGTSAELVTFMTALGFDAADYPTPAKIDSFVDWS